MLPPFRNVLGALLVSIGVVGCGDGDALPEGRSPTVPDTTFSAPLPVDDDPAVVADNDASEAVTDEAQAADPPVELPTHTPDQMKSE